MIHNHPYLHSHNSMNFDHTHTILDTKPIENFITDVCAIYQKMETIQDFSSPDTKSIIATFLNKLKENFSHEETYVILNDPKQKWNMQVTSIPET